MGRVALKVLKKANSTKEVGDCSNKKKIVGLWKSIWKLQCPNKIKHFLWRACKNIIPTNFCLASRRVTSNSNYGFCGDYESTGHAV